MIANVLWVIGGVWVSGGIVLCLALARAASRPVPHVDPLGVQQFQVGSEIPHGACNEPSMIHQQPSGACAH